MCFDLVLTLAVILASDFLESKRVCLKPMSCTPFLSSETAAHSTPENYISFHKHHFLDVSQGVHVY